MKGPAVNPRAAAALLLLLAGFAGLPALEDLPLVNTQNISLEGIDALSVSYGYDNVILRESDSGGIIIREYMNRDNPRYYADVSRNAGTLRIRGGRRPWFFKSSLRVRAEIYLPPAFRGDLRIANSSGTFRAETDILDCKTIDVSVSSGSTLLNRLSAGTVSIRVSSGDINISSIEGRSFVSVSSGRLQIGELAGTEHRIKISSGRALVGFLRGAAAVEISSGTIILEQSRGKLDVGISSGSVSAGNFSGEGSFELSSGNLNLDIGELTGDLRFRLSSGRADINIPEELSFNLDALTKGGGVQITGGNGETLRVSGEGAIIRPIGPAPESAGTRTIYARTSSGTVTINRR
jgi:hypothetical protein